MLWGHTSPNQNRNFEYETLHSTIYFLGTLDPLGTGLAPKNSSRDARPVTPSMAPSPSNLARDFPLSGSLNVILAAEQFRRCIVLSAIVLSPMILSAAEFFCCCFVVLSFGLIIKGLKTTHRLLSSSLFMVHI